MQDQYYHYELISMGGGEGGYTKTISKASLDCADWLMLKFKAFFPFVLPLIPLCVTPKLNLHEPDYKIITVSSDNCSQCFYLIRKSSQLSDVGIKDMFSFNPALHFWDLNFALRCSQEFIFIYSKLIFYTFLRCPCLISASSMESL